MNQKNSRSDQTKALSSRLGFFSIANQLRIGIVLLVGVSLLLTAGLLISLSFQVQNQQLEILQQEHSRAVAVRIDAYVSDLQRKLGYLARVRGLSDMSLEIQQSLLEGLTRHNRAYETVAILDEMAQVTVAVSPFGETTWANLADSPQFLRPFKQGEDFVGPIEVDPSRGPIVTLAVPIRDAQDEVDGVLLARVNLNFLWVILSQTEVGKSGYIYMIDNRNFLIAETGSTVQNFELKDISERAFIRDLTTSVSQELKSYQGLRGVTVLGAITPVRSAPWNIVVELPTAEAYAPIQKMLWIMGLSLGVALVIAVGLGIFFSRQIVWPLQRLTEASAQISAGKLSTQVKINKRNELGILAKTFNEMAAQLRTLVSNLEQREKALTTANNQLRASEEQFRNAFEHTAVGMALVDTNGQFMQVNAALSEMLGYSAQELEAMTWKAITHPDDMDRSVGYMGQMLVGEIHTFQSEARYLHKNGEVVWGHISASFLPSSGQVLPDSSPKNFIAQIQDISEQKRSAEELYKYHHNLENLVKERTIELTKSNKQLQAQISERKRAEEAADEARLAAELANRAKSAFLAQMSHELRTPLNGILGYAQILDKARNLSRKQKDGLDIIQRSGEHLLALINELLDLSKIEAGQMELSVSDFRLPEILQNLANIFQVRAQQKGVLFIYEPSDSLPPAVRGDPKRLQQVLINLLGNAIKFTEAGGVTFKVGYHEAKLRFQVEDTGIGMVPEALNEIFEPFRQLSNQHVIGTGLGLAISDKLVEMMGGQIGVKSKLGEGSTFWVELDLPKVPVGAILGGCSLSESAGPSGPDSFVQSVVSGGKGYKVLIVDDKSDNRSLLVNMLAPLGFSILEASDGQEALIKAHQFQPDVILMDIKMPVMDGLEATRRLRKQPLGREMVIIVISAGAFDHNRQQSLDAGASNFIAKPFRLEKLLSLLQSHLGLSLRDEDQAAETRETKKAPPGAVVAPPAAELLTLLDLAKRGNIRRIEKQLDKLAQLDEQYLPFANELRQLAKGFKMKNIEEFVIKHMK